MHRMYFSLFSICTSFFLISSCGGDIPVEENGTDETVRKETIKAESQLKQLNLEVKEQGKQHAEEILKKIETNGD